MTSLDLARWQFGLTTLLHFAIVGVSIGLVFFVALMQTRYHRTGDERWLRLTKYYGRAMIVVFAVGVVTGLLQTFQFGLNWAGFSRYVGDIFGAPLALEGLAAFFVESVFLGLWIFGAGKLRPRIHLACIWIVSAATMISAYSILVANSWMQHPVGYEIVDGRAQLTDVVAVMFNATIGLTVAHVLFTSLMTGAVIVLGIACVQLKRGVEVSAFGAVARMATVIGLVAALAAAGAGHFQGVLALEQQPMKMAAAEAHYETEAPAGLSLFALGGLSTESVPPFLNVKVPAALSFLNNFSLSSEVRGIEQLQREAEARYGPGDYTPFVALMYWSFRVMVGGGVLLIALFAVGCRLAATGRLERSRWFLRAAMCAMAIPFAAQAGGWLLREGGRQPWVVDGLLRTDVASSDVSVWAVAGSLGAFLAVYAVVFWTAARVLRSELSHGLPAARPAPRATADLALGY
ncbi:cytochrome ubiquinol oxidase subunit I [Solirubrobacter sp. CPCC 204708]|uniref:Cytochrome ubiquinol oxidase subunit I n=1 Tax=Solirubrobacter deserti TaxID=2282478 RepID=A0ABT4RF01_9ACTN|nr:cytochrome ubiquinol oxidase subunit I [Solirubrobacter deserti]MBE2318673.1 cytochrome ubiquinol oxidase subunit I [Solirubrobacter deserti]MDA0137131.1 cytochrome ubiquinol oxidase subunit I [Solirubrobacter deserti]